MSWPGATHSGSKASDAGWRALAAHFSAWKRRLAAIGALSVLAAILDAAVLVSIAPLLATLTSGNSSVSGSLAGIEVEMTWGHLLLASLILVVLRAITSLLARILEARILAAYEASMRMRLVREFVGASWAVQASERSGQIQSYLGGHISRSQGALRAVSMCLGSLSGLVILVGGAVVIGGPVVLLGLLAIVLIGIALRPFQRISTRASLEQAELAPTWTSQVAEMTAMVKETRLFGLGDVVVDRRQRTVEKMRALRTREQMFTSGAPIFYETAGLVLVLASVGAIRVYEPQNLTALGAAAILLVRALMHGRNLQNQYQILDNLRPFVEALDRRIEVYAEAREPDGDEQLVEVRSFELTNVGFRYVPGLPVLEDVSIDIHIGRALGIIGPSGTGKSTLLELLLRLRSPTTGSVRINGTGISEYTSSSLYRKIRFVPQDPRLFDASVRENVASFAPATEAELWDALRSAGLDREVEALGGLDAPVGELGRELSGGQRQRLCIARALIGQPDVLIMDEPTGALDAHSEAIVQESLRKLKNRVTLIIVAHRLSTVDLCDEILILKDGRVRAHGERTHLQETDEYYQDALRLSSLR